MLSTRSIRYWLAIIFAALIVPFTAPAQQTEACRDMAAEVLAHVNEHRAKKGLKPLETNDIVAKEALKHSRNMAAGKVPFSHDGFDNRTAKIKKQLTATTAWAENVAYGPKNGKAAVDMWLTSPNHKENMEGNYNLTGIGVAGDKKGNLYFTQIFIRRN
jgi:uncharacterized protein YkwD